MEVLILTVFVSVVLVSGAVLFFLWTLHQRSHEHGDRLALLPLAGEQHVTQNPRATTQRNERTQ